MLLAWGHACGVPLLFVWRDELFPLALFSAICMPLVTVGGAVLLRRCPPLVRMFVVTIALGVALSLQTVPAAAEGAGETPEGEVSLAAAPAIVALPLLAITAFTTLFVEKRHLPIRFTVALISLWTVIAALDLSQCPDGYPLSERIYWLVEPRSLGFALLGLWPLALALAPPRTLISR